MAAAATPFLGIPCTYASLDGHVRFATIVTFDQQIAVVSVGGTFEYHTGDAVDFMGDSTSVVISGTLLEYDGELCTLALNAPAQIAAQPQPRSPAMRWLQRTGVPHAAGELRHADKA